jgi:UDP-glucose 4-epimerase
MSVLEHHMGRLAGRRVLVLGGAGFIGSHLVDGLIEVGASRIAVVDDLSLGRTANIEGALEREEVSFHRVDACDQAALERVIATEGRFDVCFNLAVIPLPHSLLYPRDNVDRNVSMTTAVCELGRAGAFARLVQFSSSEIYGSAMTTPITEDHPLHPHTPYAAAKAATDLVALSYGGTFGLDVVVVRPFNTYGERQNDQAYAGLIPIVIRRAQAGQPVVINGDGEQTRDMTYVSDTVRGALAIGGNAELFGRCVNLGHGTEVSVNDMVASIQTTMGIPDHPVVHGPERPADVRRLLAGIDVARAEVGFEPQVSVADGLERTVRWYLSVPSDAAR